MRKKYENCQSPSGDCSLCGRMSSGADCHGRRISPLELHRRAAGLTQAELSAMAGVNVRQIRRVELGEADAGNLTARNLIAIADALGAEIRELL